MFTGVGQQQFSSQSGVLPSYSMSQAKTAFQQSSVPLPRPQQPLDPRQRGRAAASSNAAAAPSSRATSNHSSKKTGQREPLPDISEKELPLSFVDRRRLDFSAERIQVSTAPSVLDENPYTASQAALSRYVCLQLGVVCASLQAHA